MITVTMIKDWGPFKPGDVITADEVRARQLIHQELGLEGHQAVNDVDVKNTVDEMDSDDTQPSS